jgi:hypothetical protein
MPEMDEVPCFGKTETFGALFSEMVSSQYFTAYRSVVGCFVPDWSIPGLVHAL